MAKESTHDCTTCGKACDCGSEIGCWGCISCAYNESEFDSDYDDDNDPDDY